MGSRLVLAVVLTAIIVGAAAAAITYSAVPKGGGVTTVTTTVTSTSTAMATVTVTKTVTATTPATPTTTTAPPVTITPGKPRVLYISHWGFVWDKIKKIVIEPFEKKYNVKVELISGRTAERYAKLVEGVEPIPDIVFLPDYYTQLAAEKGLLEELDLSKVPNYKKLYPFIREQLGKTEVGKYGVPHTIQDVSIIYRADLHKPVTSFKDLWREDFKGYVALPGITTTTGPLVLILASITYGGSIDNVEPGFKALEELKPAVVTYYLRSADLTSLFERGEVHIAPGLRYQLGAMQKVNKSIGGGIKYAIPKEGSIYVLNLMSIPKAAKNKDLAYALMNFWLSTEVQEKLAEEGVDAPVNAEVTLPPNHYFNIAPVTKKPIYVDPAILASKLKGWIEEWKARIGG